MCIFRNTVDADAVVQLAEQVNSELKLVSSELPFKYHMHELGISICVVRWRRWTRA